jgi:mono/diheme cytochrome c family protein
MNNRLLLLLCGLMIPMASSVLAETPPGYPGQGQKLYEQNCLRCHGGRFDGNGPEADSLRLRPTNLRTYLMIGRGSSDLEKVIRKGRKDTPMHGWDAALTDEEIYDLVAYLRTEIPQIEVRP